MEVRLNQNDKKVFKIIGLIVFLGFWLWFLFFSSIKNISDYGLYEIKIQEVYINGHKFNNDFWGSALPITLLIYENGKIVFRKELGRLRGIWKLEHVYFKLNKTKLSMYKVELRENVIVSKGIVMYNNIDPENNKWPFDSKMVMMDKKSYIKFKSKLLKSFK